MKRFQLFTSILNVFDIFTHILPIFFFCPVMLLAFFYCAAYIQVPFRLDFIMIANIMNYDQTAPWEQSDLGSYCLQYTRL